MPKSGLDLRSRHAIHYFERGLLWERGEELVLFLLFLLFNKFQNRLYILIISKIADHQTVQELESKAPGSSVQFQCLFCYGEQVQWPLQSPCPYP